MYIIQKRCKKLYNDKTMTFIRKGKQRPVKMPAHVFCPFSVWALDDFVRRLYSQHGTNCVCPAAAEPVNEFLAENGPITADTHCWHRFAFAFVRQLGAPGPDVLTWGFTLNFAELTVSSGQINACLHNQQMRAVAVQKAWSTMSHNGLSCRRTGKGVTFLKEHNSVLYGILWFWHHWIA